MKNTYVLPVKNFEKFEKKITKLNKKATQLGLDKIEIEIVSTEMYETDRGLDIPCHKIKVAGGDNIKLEGYTFVGKLKKNIGDTFIYSGEEVPSEQRKIKTCQHCNTNRARKLLYILKNEKNEYITVGKSCLVDFIGHKNAKSIAEYYELLEETLLDDDSMLIYDEEEDLEKFSLSVFSLDQVLKCAITAIDTMGYIKTEYGESSTKDTVLRMLHRDGDEYSKLFKKALEVSQDDINEIKDIVNNMQTNSSYIENLKSLIKDGYVKGIHLGYAVSIPLTAYNEKSRLSNKEIDEKSFESRYLGEVGEKLEILATYNKYVHYIIESFYSRQIETVYIHIFIDENGNNIVWQTASSKSFKANEKYLIKGTIKAHKEYKGVKQTILTRLTSKQVSK